MTQTSYPNAQLFHNLQAGRLPPSLQGEGCVYPSAHGNADLATAAGPPPKG